MSQCSASLYIHIYGLQYLTDGFAINMIWPRMLRLQTLVFLHLLVYNLYMFSSFHLRHSKMHWPKVLNRANPDFVLKKGWNATPCWWKYQQQNKAMMVPGPAHPTFAENDGKAGYLHTRWTRAFSVSKSFSGCFGLFPPGLFFLDACVAMKIDGWLPADSFGRGIDWSNSRQFPFSDPSGVAGKNELLGGLGLFVQTLLVKSCLDRWQILSSFPHMCCLEEQGSMVPGWHHWRSRCHSFAAAFEHELVNKIWLLVFGLRPSRGVTLS